MDPYLASATAPDLAPALEEIVRAVVDFLPKLILFLRDVVHILVGISIPLSILFLFVIIYCVEQLKKIRNEEAKIHEAKVELAFVPETETGNSDMARRWDSVKKHMETDNQNDWRRAIMDADTILFDLLNQMGYKGESIGEKLKRVARGDFETIDDAWEAHKIRNKIAHEGDGFELSHHEAKKAFEHYRRVFDEFYYI